LSLSGRFQPAAMIWHGLFQKQSEGLAAAFLFACQGEWPRLFSNP